MRSEKIKSHAEVKPRPNNSQKPALAELFPCKGTKMALSFVLEKCASFPE